MSIRLSREKINFLSRQILDALFEEDQVEFFDESNEIRLSIVKSIEEAESGKFFTENTTMKKSPSSENFSTKIDISYKNKSYIEIKEIVRYSEVDRMGVSLNKNYLEWFEIGRTEFCLQKNLYLLNLYNPS